MATTLSSPGVEVREIDNSLRVQTNGGTTVFIPGFASQGPVEEITSISSITDFEQIFGVPTNAAERYFYYTVLAVLNNSSSSTTILVSRLPYGNGEGDTVSNAYTLLAYPAVPIVSQIKTVTNENNKVIEADKLYYPNTDDNQDPVFSPKPLNVEPSKGGEIQVDDADYGKRTKKEGGNTIVYENNITYVVGEPTSFQISLAEYYDILTDILFTSKDSEFTEKGWSNVSGSINQWKDLNKAAFIIIDKSRSIINESLEGNYLCLNDNMFNEPNGIVGKGNVEEYNSIKSIKFSRGDGDTKQACSGNKYQYLNPEKLDFELEGSNQGSLSKVIQKDTSSYTADNIDLDDVISCSLVKLAKTTTGTKALKLAYSLKESYNFSLGSNRVTSSVKTSQPISLYGPNVLKKSNNIVVTVNPFISKAIKSDMDGYTIGKVRIAGEKLISKINLIDSESEWGYVDETTPDKEAKIEKLNAANNRNLIVRAGIDNDVIEKLFDYVPNEEEQNVWDKVKYLNKCQSLYSFGTYTIDKNANNWIGEVPHKISRALTLIENDEEYPDIDIVCEAGLGTIYVYGNVETSKIISSKEGVVESWVDASGTEKIVDYSAGDITPDEGYTFVARNYVDSLIIEGVEDLRTGKSNLNASASTVKDMYMSVQNAFLSFANSFANGGRGDVFYLSDILRGILIKGSDTKVENLYGTELINTIYTGGSDLERVNNSWSTSIYYPIKHLYDSFTSSFAAVYAQLFKIEDSFTNKFIWVPASGYIAAAMAASDTMAGPWLAAAGLNRGVVQGVLDVAVNPVLRQRDDLYKISINAVPKIANIGSVIYGIRTMIKKPTSFDQVTCRRTALLLGKTMKKYLRYYVFEPNTSYTRLAMYNDLQPYLESIKAAGGIYNYRLVTDESINTPEIINNGEMAVDVSVQYTRTAEFVTLSMTAEKYTSSVMVSEG